jgi:hypothetical protein
MNNFSRKECFESTTSLLVPVQWKMLMTFSVPAGKFCLRAEAESREAESIFDGMVKAMLFQNHFAPTGDLLGLNGSRRFPGRPGE